MGVMKHIPELVRVNGRWTVEPFTPMQAAFDWPEIRAMKATIYVLELSGYVKVGITRDFEKRYKQFVSHMPIKPRTVAKRTVPFAGLRYAEAWLHKKLGEYRSHGEWFEVEESTVLALLPSAVRRADAYALRCAQWHAEDMARSRPHA